MCATIGRHLILASVDLLSRPISATSPFGSQSGYRNHTLGAALLGSAQRSRRSGGPGPHGGGRSRNRRARCLAAA